MYSKKKYVLLVMLLSFIFVGCTQNRNDKIHKIYLTIYGKSDNCESYSTQDNQTIEAIVNKLNSISLKNNELSHEKDLDLPKGITYQLELIGDQTIKYVFIDDYFIYNHHVYRINNSQSIINTIKEYMKVIH